MQLRYEPAFLESVLSTLIQEREACGDLRFTHEYHALTDPAYHLAPAAREDQNVQGRGVWKEGTWLVVMVRGMRSKSDRDAQFTPGQSLPVAFAVWDGAQGDRDGQKAVSVWQRVELEKAAGK